jgi:hypothetical protein
MSEFETWIEEGLSKAGIPVTEHLTDQQSSDLIARVALRYSLDGLPLRLWEKPARPVVVFDIESIELATLLKPLVGRCWFIPETGRYQKPAYWLETRDVPNLLEACSVGLNYYIVGPDMNWLIMESDHQQYLVLGTAISEDLKNLGAFYP